MSIKQLISAEDLWTMPEIPGKRFELVNGELVEVPGAGVIHSWIMGNIYRLLFAFAMQHRLGLVFADGASYVLRRDPDHIRIPDVSFVARERVPASGMPKGYWMLAPDLAVEVVSPEDRATELRDKARDYLEAGTRQVWVLWPDERAITLHQPDRAPTDLGPDDTLDGGDLLPGFQVRVAALFDVE